MARVSLFGGIKRIDMPGIYYARIPYAQWQAYEFAVGNRYRVKT